MKWLTDIILMVVVVTFIIVIPSFIIDYLCDYLDHAESLIFTAALYPVYRILCKDLEDLNA